MKQIVTLEKEIPFKTMIGEIENISIEPDLEFVNDTTIEGNLLIAGNYKLTYASTVLEKFDYKIPVEIMLSNALAKDSRNVSIDEFTYNIVNEEILAIKLNILIEGIEIIDIDDNNLEREEPKFENTTDDEKEDENEVLEEVLDTNINDFINSDELKESITTTIDNDDLKTDNIIDNNKTLDGFFNSIDESNETYSTYSVYTLRENDNLDDIINKYKTNRETLSEYNDLDNLSVGSKIIIPTVICESNE